MKKPDIATFRDVLRKTGGHITKTAAAFKVDRCTIYAWMRDDPTFRQAVKDERGMLVDECLVSARILALGIPEKDADGRFVGWIERPDGNMLRYLLSTLGRKEGFGDDEDGLLDGDAPSEIRRGVNVKDWLRKEMEDRRDDDTQP